MFEKALRQKYRFQLNGQLSVEDLWDLGLTNLDKIYQNLSKELQTAKGESLLTQVSKENEVLQDKIEIIKYIVAKRLQELNEKEALKEKKEYAKKIGKIIEEKEESKLRDLSVEELKKLIQ